MRDQHKIRFVHRSFQEYFCALHLSREREDLYPDILTFFINHPQRVKYDYTFEMLYDLDESKVERLIYVPFLEELFDKNRNGRFYYFSTKAPRRYTDVSYPDNCYLVFGKETKGLPEKLLFDHPDTTVRIPMISEARSLNLSNSVAIAVYEVLRRWDFPELQNNGRLREFDWSSLQINN